MTQCPTCEKPLALNHEDSQPFGTMKRVAATCECGWRGRVAVHEEEDASFRVVEPEPDPEPVEVAEEPPEVQPLEPGLWPNPEKD